MYLLTQLRNHLDLPHKEIWTWAIQRYLHIKWAKRVLRRVRGHFRNSIYENTDEKTHVYLHAQVQRFHKAPVSPLYFQLSFLVEKGFLQESQNLKAFPKT
jgi:hypothetical protein